MTSLYSFDNFGRSLLPVRWMRDKKRLFRLWW